MKDLKREGKTSYAAGNVTLGTGSWFMDDALTGNLSTDRKTGSWSARVRNTGLLHMNFNKTGAGTVTIQHAVFGTDGASTWQLWSSTNSGQLLDTGRNDCDHQFHDAADRDVYG
jgi:endonuclease G